MCTAWRTRQASGRREGAAHERVPPCGTLAGQPDRRTSDDPAPKPPSGSVGIDLGVKELATLSDGTVIRNPHALKSNLTRLRKAQRSLSRKRKGSNRRRKARANVARLHARVANLRRDLLDKTTAMLAHTYADISIEDLNVAGMVKNHGSPNRSRTPHSRSSDAS